MLVTLQMLSHLIPRKIFLADLSLPTCHSYFHSWRDALLSSVPQDAQGVSDFLLPSIHLSAVKTDFPRMMPWLAMWRWGESLLVFWLLSPPFAFWKRTHQLLGGVCCFSILLYGFLCLEIASLNLNSAHRLGLWYRTGWLVLGLLSPTCSAFSSCCLAWEWRWCHCYWIHLGVCWKGGGLNQFISQLWLRPAHLSWKGFLTLSLQEEHWNQWSL